jgi:hypothetical protein
LEVAAVKLTDLYRRARACGIAVHPRGRERVIAGLERTREQYRGLADKKHLKVVMAGHIPPTISGSTSSWTG